MTRPVRYARPTMGITVLAKIHNEAQNLEWDRRMTATFSQATILRETGDNVRYCIARSQASAFNANLQAQYPAARITEINATTYEVKLS